MIENSDDRGSDNRGSTVFNMDGLVSKIVYFGRPPMQNNSDPGTQNFEYNSLNMNVLSQ